MTVFNFNYPKKRKNISTSAMSDIGFLLLIFIILISLSNHNDKTQIEYGEASNIEKITQENSLDIWVEKNGTISVDGNIYSLKVLEEMLVTKIMNNPSIIISIISDKNTPYEYLNHIINMLQTLEHNQINFILEEKK